MVALGTGLAIASVGGDQVDASRVGVARIGRALVPQMAVHASLGVLTWEAEALVDGLDLALVARPVVDAEALVHIGSVALYAVSRDAWIGRAFVDVDVATRTVKTVAAYALEVALQR